MRAAIDDVLRQSVPKHPERLHHYTTQAGLFGIVKDCGIFLSDVRFLNDASEILYGRELFFDRLRFAAESGLSPRAPRVLDEAVKLASLPAIGSERWLARTFVASFCENGNLLSQWRAYARGSGGCSIAFGTADLIDAVEVQTVGQQQARKPTTTLRRVLYEPEHQRSLIDAIIERAFVATAQVAHLSTPVYIAHSLSYAIASTVLPLIKAPVFEEEKEWRLVCCVPSGFDFRLDRRGIVPFVLCKLGRPDASGHRVLPIEHVVVGPSHDVELNHLAVREFIRANGISVDENTVRRSGVPLRG